MRWTRQAAKLDVLVESVDGRPLQFCSNVTETSDGTIYFTESTSAFHFEHFLGAMLEARGRARLFRLATDGTVTTLRRRLYFANGVTATADESALVFAETHGPPAVEVLAHGPPGRNRDAAGASNLPGMPDNISTGSDGRIWVAMVTPSTDAAEALMPQAPCDPQTDLAAARRGCSRRSNREVWVVGVRRRQRRAGRRSADHARRFRRGHRAGRIGGQAVDVDDRVPRRRAHVELPVRRTGLASARRLQCTVTVTAWLPGNRRCDRLTAITMATSDVLAARGLPGRGAGAAWLRPR